MAPRAFSFPADHGPHPDFRSEWWYFTGNLAAANGRHFGFQLTFFRVALSPDAAPRESAWATNQAWMAHFTLTDTEAGQFHSAERLGRGALGIAGAEASPFRVWVDDWQAASRAPTDAFPLRLSASDEDVAIELELSAMKPLVLQGEEGWDRKGPEPGNASYYYAYTRLAARGQRANARCRIRGDRHGLDGSRMEHECARPRPRRLGLDLAAAVGRPRAHAVSAAQEGRQLRRLQQRRIDSAGRRTDRAVGSRIRARAAPMVDESEDRRALSGRVVHRDSVDSDCRSKSSRDSTTRSSTCRSATGRAPCSRRVASTPRRSSARGIWNSRATELHGLRRRKEKPPDVSVGGLCLGSWQ